MNSSLWNYKVVTRTSESMFSFITVYIKKQVRGYELCTAIHFISVRLLHQQLLKNFNKNFSLGGGEKVCFKLS